MAIRWPTSSLLVCPPGLDAVPPAPENVELSAILADAGRSQPISDWVRGKRADWLALGPEPPSSSCDAVARRAGAEGRARPLLRFDRGDPERTSAGSSDESPTDEGIALPRPLMAPRRVGRSVDPVPRSWLPLEAIVGPSGARDVSDFSTGTVETASKRLGGELPGTVYSRSAGDWAGNPASGTTVEGSGRPSRLDRSKVLPCCVIWLAASAPARLLEVCGGACEGSRATMFAEGRDSLGWTSTRAIFRGGGSSSLFGVAPCLATLAQSIFSALRAAGSGVLGASFAASGTVYSWSAGVGDSVLGIGSSASFCRTMARASGGLASSTLAASGRMSNGPLGSVAPVPSGVTSTLGARGTSAKGATCSMSRGCTWAAAGA